MREPLKPEHLPPAALPEVQKAAIYCNASGRNLSGFALDFIQSSIKTTLAVPLTQHVVRLAVAKVILQSILDQRSPEIVCLYEDLRNRSSRFLNLEKIADFVADYYQSIGINGIPKAPASRYGAHFQYEINVSLKCIADTCRHFIEERDPWLQQLLEITCSPSNLQDFSIVIASQLLEKMDPELRLKLLMIFKSSLEKLIKSEVIAQERNELIKKLQKLSVHHQTEMRMAISSYTSVVNTLADSTIEEQILLARSSD